MIFRRICRRDGVDVVYRLYRLFKQRYFSGAYEAQTLPLHSVKLKDVIICEYVQDVVGVSKDKLQILIISS